MQYKDYYKILGVDKNSSPDEIRKAYRNLAKKYHPDVSKEKNAEEKYKEINEAYEVLKDPAKKQKYDNFGMNYNSGQDFTPPPGWQHVEFNGQDLGGNFSDFFNNLFGSGFGGFNDVFNSRHQQPVKSDSEVDLNLTLEQIITGGTRELILKNSNGTKRNLKVNLPKGITEGSRIKLPGKSEGGGDIYVNIHVAPHKIYKVDGYNLTREIKVNAWDAVLGKDFNTETLNGAVTVKMPPGIQDGQKLRLRGKGLPGRNGIDGDMFIEIKIEIPRHVNSRQKALWEELARLG